MAHFSFIAKDTSGKTQKGLVESQNIKQANNLLHERGYYIIELKEVISNSLTTSFKRSGVSFNDLVNFTRQLSTMITAGLTLIESLVILKQQLNKKSLVTLVGQLEEEVQGGKSFASTLEKFPKVFPPVYLALVRAGEASGKLDVILGRLADNLEKSRNFKSKVKGALIYPLIVVSGMTTVFVIIMTVVVPRLTSLYKEFGVDLPLPTQILISISGFVVNTWWLVLLLLIIGFFSFLKFRSSWFGEHFLASISLNIPVFGVLIKEATLVEITRTMAILIDGGIPILTALDISRDASGNILFKEAFTAASKKVEKGYPLSEPLSQNKLFPPILSQMVSVGEQTGKLGDSLTKLSRYFETEAETAVTSLTTIIEPLIMIVLGLGVGFLVMAVLLPIYSLTSKF
ncbi:hypothetical protein A2960_02410 [Candidatus Gottesmanbacteria bacterium RIFCSPLOWO2_01_FULL_39_12b]|uniref:Type II secretion system protein GspF domain-containing protein n=1 Tax=Candidatus Gottesmanbacteria bacterium RIFCSPLOWO2_01_FULL_39_12b TaxID=1798388 RepID=A0A1F6ARS1_9BACT|nr:MAG: hypothetical protein A2960_02410 [Candidatus Gottesmanbacteria bacterium RIFCSPLOWO2_01_FULL_39_12b]